jgi:hypothetical protein
MELIATAESPSLLIHYQLILVNITRLLESPPHRTTPNPPNPQLPEPNPKSYVFSALGAGRI